MSPEDEIRFRWAGECDMKHVYRMYADAKEGLITIRSCVHDQLVMRLDVDGCQVIVANAYMMQKRIQRRAK